MLVDKIETRTTTTRYRGLVLICSAKEAHSDFADDINFTATQYILGHTIAIGTLCDVIQKEAFTDSQWKKTYVDNKYMGSVYGWVFKDIHRINPFPYKGQLGLVRATKEIIGQINIIW
jgi:hypothetical protein